jgi:hypothetical protein
MNAEELRHIKINKLVEKERIIYNKIKNIKDTTDLYFNVSKNNKIYLQREIRELLKIVNTLPEA